MKLPLILMLGFAGALMATSPAVVWQVSGQGRGTPAADESTAFFLSKYHEVLAVDRRDGRVRWRVSTGEIGDSTEGFAVALSGNVLAVGDYNVTAFDRRDGTFRWRFVPRDGYAPGSYLGEAVAGLVLTGSASGVVHAIDGEKGVSRWSTVVATDGNALVLPPAAHESAVAAGYTEKIAPQVGGVAVIDLDSGRLRWKRAFPKPADPTLGTHSAGGPVFWGRTVIAASGDGNIYGFDIDTGDIQWSIPRVTTTPGDLIQPDRDMRALALSRGILVAGSLTGYVLAYDVATRREKWRFETGRFTLSVSLRISADDEAVYLPTFSGELIALDLETGEEQWRRGNFKEGFMWAPLVHGDHVLAAASSAGYFAFPRVRRP